MSIEKTLSLESKEPVHGNLGDFSELKTKNPYLGEWELDMENQNLYWSNNQYRIYGYEPGEIELN